jgi:hypothetical protein
VVTFDQTPSHNFDSVSRHTVVETIMAQFQQAHWVATENITRFEQQLKTKPDTYQRKLLESLIVLEQEKLKAIEAARSGPSPDYR